MIFCSCWYGFFLPSIICPRMVHSVFKYRRSIGNWPLLHQPTLLDCSSSRTRLDNAREVEGFWVHSRFISLHVWGKSWDRLLSSQQQQWALHHHCYIIWGGEAPYLLCHIYHRLKSEVWMDVDCKEVLQKSRTTAQLFMPDLLWARSECLWIISQSIQQGRRKRGKENVPVVYKGLNTPWTKKGVKISVKPYNKTRIWAGHVWLDNLSYHMSQPHSMCHDSNYP